MCIPNTYRDFYYYLADDIVPLLGARVWVPFRKKICVGVVIGHAPNASISLDRLKSIQSLLDKEPLLSDTMLSLCKWVSAYYQTPLSEVLPLALPKRYRLGKPPLLQAASYYTLIVDPDQAHRQLSKRALRQHALIDYLFQTGSQEETIVLEAKFTRAQLKALCDLKIVACHPEPELSEAEGALSTTCQPEDATEEKGRATVADNARHTLSKASTDLLLNSDQTAAVQALAITEAGYRCFLLYGVTGSGKTEVYLQIIARYLEQDKQVLILVPEIGLTPQLLNRFKERFKHPIVTIHSHLSEGERQRAWYLASNNKIKLVIGTRAAIFTPMPALGLIVLDEEHDSSYKQTDGVHYSAHDTALLRAHRAQIPIILGSATPSLESLYNAIQEKYTLLRLHEKATHSKPLEYTIVDTRQQRLEEGLARRSLLHIEQHLAAGNQVLVFINRRGYAPLLLCQDCGWIADCNACDSHCTVHRARGKLICHHCGLIKPVPRLCGACGMGVLIPIGSGTQRVYEYLRQCFPAVKTLRVDRDEVRGKETLDKRLDQIHRGDVQLIVGTQMLAKGHHFPRLTLVVILDTETGFYNQDFRSLERLGQLITQVAGRAGREAAAGQVVIQTYLPNHPVLNLLVQKGYDAFAKQLLHLRKTAQLPPYYFLALIRAHHCSAEKVTAFLNAVKLFLNKHSVNVLGPAPAPLTRKSHQYRMQLLLKSSSRQSLQQALHDLRVWVMDSKRKNNIQWSIDVDPMDLS
ncbi:MAG: primosomal protein N' [Legionella sp.]|nr:primosomal protein N' [Legionella sp.]